MVSPRVRRALLSVSRSYPSAQGCAASWLPHPGFPGGGAWAPHCGSVSCWGAWTPGWVGFRSCSAGSVVGAPGLESTGSGVTAHRLTACGILSGQELNWCLLHWQADYSPLNHDPAPHTAQISGGWCFPTEPRSTTSHRTEQWWLVPSH